MNKINPIDLLLQKKVSTSPSTSHDGLVTLASNESEVKKNREKNSIKFRLDFQIVSLRNTIRLLKDELWHLKMSRTSNELNKLQLPNRNSQTSQIAEIYQNSNLILNVKFFSSRKNSRRFSFSLKRICLRASRITKSPVKMSLQNAK